MRNLIFTAEYSGTHYKGWTAPRAAAQNKSSRTLFEKFTRAFSQVTGEVCQPVCAARTEAGVHALGQTIQVCTASALPVSELRVQLNSILPMDFVILSAAEMPERFHAALSATERRWLIRFQIGDVQDPFRRDSTCFLTEMPDLSRMEQAAALLTGRHDFKNFTSVRKKKGTEKMITSIRIDTAGDELYLHLCGNDFLPHMPGILAEFLTDIGLGKRDISCIPAVFSGEEACGISCPAAGIYLEKILYDTPYT